MYYVIGQEAAQSTTWQLWMHRTSVYLVNNAVGGIRVRLHALDARHPGKEHFRVEPDNRGKPKSGPHSGAVLLAPGSGWPVRFDGTTAGLGQHAIRFRTTAGACLLPAPLAVRGPRASSARAALPPPEPGWVADLDLVFEQLPRGFIPVGYRGRVLEVKHGGVQLTLPLPSILAEDRPGFLMRNSFGIVLRGETRRRRLDLYPTPQHLLGPSPGDDDACRAVAIDKDQDGLLWIVEQSIHASG